MARIVKTILLSRLGWRAMRGWACAVRDSFSITLSRGCSVYCGNEPPSPGRSFVSILEKEDPMGNGRLWWLYEKDVPFARMTGTS